MTLPEHLKIGFEIYRVGNSLAEVEEQGHCEVEKGTIQIAPRLSGRRRMAVLIHEILHACWDQAEMDDLAKDDAEEAIINRLAPVLTQVLLDNPVLRACLGAAADRLAAIPC